MKPNILLITSDQHRSDAMSCAGHPCVYTPNLDQLADQGVRFSNAYSDCPVCIPARTTIITGREAHHNGVVEYAANARIERNREDFLGALVTAAGYQTCLVGKTHWHTEPYFRAGFETVVWQSLYRKQMQTQYGTTVSGDGIGFNQMTPHLNARPEEMSLSGWTVERAIEFLQLRDRDQPFFLWVSIQDPHPPFTTIEPYYSMYDGAEIPGAVRPEWSADTAQTPRALYVQQGTSQLERMSEHMLTKAQAVYYGMITHMDAQIGRLMGSLAAGGDLDETLVLYTSDHGEMLGDHGMRGKRNFLQASANIPLIVKPPTADSGLVGATDSSLVGLADLLPTICDAAGATVPGDVDGVSLLPSATAGGNVERSLFHGQLGTGHMLRDSEWKYLAFSDDGSEMLFRADDTHDEHPVAVATPDTKSGDDARLARYRALFLEHLASEDHDDLVDGSFRNDGVTKQPIEEVRSKDTSGLGALGRFEFDQRTIQDMH